MDTSERWELRAVVVEGEPVHIEGVDLWQARWEPVRMGRVVVVDPAYPTQQHSLTVYRLAGVEPAVFFPAGEFSNAVWGFYEPTKRMRDFLLTRI